MRDHQQIGDLIVGQLGHRHITSSEAKLAADALLATLDGQLLPTMPEGWEASRIEAMSNGTDEWYEDDLSMIGAPFTTVSGEPVPGLATLNAAIAAIEIHESKH